MIGLLVIIPSQPDLFLEGSGTTTNLSDLRWAYFVFFVVFLTLTHLCQPLLVPVGLTIWCPLEYRINIRDNACSKQITIGKGLGAVIMYVFCVFWCIKTYWLSVYEILQNRERSCLILSYNYLFVCVVWCKYKHTYTCTFICVPKQHHSTLLKTYDTISFNSSLSAGYFDFFPKLLFAYKYIS